MLGRVLGSICTHPNSLVPFICSFVVREEGLSGTNCISGCWDLQTRALMNHIFPMEASYSNGRRIQLLPHRFINIAVEQYQTILQTLVLGTSPYVCTLFTNHAHESFFMAIFIVSDPLSTNDHKTAPCKRQVPNMERTAQSITSCRLLVMCRRCLDIAF